MGAYQVGVQDTGARTTSGPRAGFWRRFAAALIDGVMLLVVQVALSAALGDSGRILSFLVSPVYFTALEGGTAGQTLGKRALGIRVVSFDSGGSIGYGRAFIRWIGRIISAVVIFLGYLWMLWDGEKQTWHDKMAGSVVVPVAQYPV